jgi:hypothetical protein
MQGPYCLLHTAQDILNGDRRRSHRKVRALAQGRASRFFQWPFTQTDYNFPVVWEAGWVLGLMQV